MTPTRRYSRLIRELGRLLAIVLWHRERAEAMTEYGARPERLVAERNAWNDALLATQEIVVKLRDMEANRS